MSGNSASRPVGYSVKRTTEDWAEHAVKPREGCHLPSRTYRETAALQRIPCPFGNLCGRP